MESPSHEIGTEEPAKKKRTPPAPRTGPGTNEQILVTLTAEELAANLAGRPPEHIAAFEKFRLFCVREGLNYERAAAKLRKPNGGGVYGKESVKHAMYGYREASVSLAPLVEAIETFLRGATPPKPANGYLDTELGREIAQYIEKAHERRKVGFIVGPNGIGKTTSLSHLDETLDDLTWLRMPEGGHLSTFLKSVARRRCLGEKQTLQNLSEVIMAEFPAGHKVVIDDADHCFGSKTAALGQRTLDYIRRAWEDGGWSPTLVMDPPGYKKLMGVEKSDPLRKLYSRRCDPLILPPFYRHDLDLFARVRDLPPSPEVPHKVTFTNALKQPDSWEAVPRVLEEAVAGSHKDGLFIWLGILDEAVDLAKEAGKCVSWNWVLKAYAIHNANEIAAKSICGIHPEAKKK